MRCVSSAARPVEIADEMGHSLETLLRTYTHVIKELADQTTVSGDDLIRGAKSGHIPVTCKEEIAK